MTSSKFSDLLHELEYEHEQQLAAVKHLESENSSLRSQLGLRTACLLEKQDNPSSDSKLDVADAFRQISLSNGAGNSYHLDDSAKILDQDDHQPCCSSASPLKKPWNASGAVPKPCAAQSVPPPAFDSLLEEDKPISPSVSLPMTLSGSNEVAAVASNASTECVKSGERQLRIPVRAVVFEDEERSMFSTEESTNVVGVGAEPSSTGCLKVRPSQQSSFSSIPSPTNVRVKVGFHDSDGSSDFSSPSNRNASSPNHRVSIASKASSVCSSVYSGVTEGAADERMQTMASCDSQRLSRTLFTVHDAWETKSLTKNVRRLKSRRADHAMSVDFATGVTMQHEENSRLKRVMMRPNSKFRLSWDFLTLVMVSYDVVTIPLMAFNMDDGLFTLIMDLVTACFWSADIPVSFLTGFHKEGLVEMRPSQIARKYVTTWFALDALIVITDWFFMVNQFASPGAVGLLRIGKTGRLARLFRALRLLRFMKLQGKIAEFLDLIKSDFISTIASVGLTILFIVTLNHYLACGWYFIGRWNMDEGNPNWISQNHLMVEPVVYRYTTSLHWSLTQFTPASMEIRPYNLGERTYSIIVLLFALITFSSFLGSISNAMTQLRRRRTEESRQQALLRRYFLDNHISQELGQRIWKFVKSTHFGHRQRTRTADVEILGIMPSTLRRSLHEELYRPYTTRVPIFMHYLNIDANGHQEVCFKAMEEQAYVASDDAFIAGQDAEKLYIVSSGKLRYTRERSYFHEEVRDGAWVGEPGLWLRWQHGGKLHATTSCECFNLDLDKCRVIMLKHGASASFLRVYARHFCMFMCCADDSQWGSDLWLDLAEMESIMNKAYDEINGVDEAPQMTQTETSGRASGRFLGQLMPRALNRRLSGISNS